MTVLVALLVLLTITVRFGPDTWFWLGSRTTLLYRRTEEPKRLVAEMRVRARAGNPGEARTGPLPIWHIETGHLAYLTRTGGDGPGWGVTEWATDGTIVAQWGIGWRRTEPPWYWGETSRSSASAPWIRAGVSFDDWWNALPRYQRRWP